MPVSRNRKQKRKSPRNVQIADEMVEKETKFGTISTRSGNKVKIQHSIRLPHIDAIKGEWERKAWLAWKALPKDFRKSEVRSTWIAAWLRTFKPIPHEQVSGADHGGQDQAKEATAGRGAGGSGDAG